MRAGVGIASAALAVCALPAGGHEIDIPRMELFIAVISQNGCRMSDTVADRELPQYGFTRQETHAIVADLIAHNRARVDYATDTIKLDEETCF